MSHEKNLPFKLLAIAVGLITAFHGVQAITPSSVTSRIESRNREEAVLGAIRGPLSEIGNAGRVYYRGECSAGSELFVGFPHLATHVASKDGKGFGAIVGVFSGLADVTVTHDAGMPRIFVGSRPSGVLNTRISNVHFSPLQRYNASMAIDAILDAGEVQEAIKENGIVFPIEYSDGLVTPPAPGLPHLPRSLSEMTVDQALDVVAKTFGGVVLYGSCTQPRTFTVRYSPVAQYKRARSK